MEKNTLRKTCVSRLGQCDGPKMFELMLKIADQDFCVATGFRKNEISIARNCGSRGTVFTSSEDYRSIVAPNGDVLDVENITPEDILKYLHNQRPFDDHLNCSYDKRFVR